MADPVAGAIELFHGQPSLTLALPGGDRLRVMLHGAHVVSWVAADRERLYLSPRGVFDGRSAIRGGVPICFPQFNQRGSLPKHGFARNLLWALEGSPTAFGDQAYASLRLVDGPATRRHWHQAFDATLGIDLRPGALKLTLTVRNPGDVSLDFTGALHTYLAVDDIGDVSLEGLDGQPEWDALRDRHGHAQGPLCFDGEFDRVYAAAHQELVLKEGSRRLHIDQSDGWAETVVWNPGPEAGLTDLPADGYAHMLCVEAAQVAQAISVPPGGIWQGWQRLRVA